MNPLDLVLSRLDRTRQLGPSQWSARCPAHDDRSPSLGISIGDDGRVLLNCFAGCTVDVICAALGLAVRDLFSGAPPPASARPALPPPPAPRAARFATADDATRAVTASVRRGPGGGPNLQQSYVYTDAVGHEVMRVLRYQLPDGAKTFRPIGRVGDGWSIGDPEGALPLYRLPTLTAAGTAYVVEGEKAADAAAALGLVATTSAHGARSAAKSDWSPLAGKDVVVLPDNDKAGRSYADEVAAILIQLDPPARVRIACLPDLPEHGDVVEFVAARRAAGMDDQAIRAEIDELVTACGGFGGGVVGALAISQGLSGPPQDTSSHGGAPSGGIGGAPPGPSRESGPTVDAAFIRKSMEDLRASGGVKSANPEPKFGEPEPLPNDLPSVDRFDPWMLPRAFFAWVVDIAERIQCPVDFPAVAAMVAIASVLGRKVGIRPKRHDDWLVVANLWGALIGRPGVMKTPPLQEATRPLTRLEVDAKVKFEADIHEYLAQSMVFDAKKKEAQKGAGKGTGENDAATVADIRALLETAPKRPVRRRRIVNDSTVEKLGEILNENPNGVLVLRDELVGFFRNLDKEGQEGARSFYLEAWGGTGRFTYDRIARGTVDIDAAIVSILGSIQPGPLAQYLREAVAGGRGDDGLMSRFQLAVWPDPSPEWKNVDRWPDTKSKNTAYGVFKWLNELQPEDVGAVHDKHDDDGIPFLRFDPCAQRAFDRWRGGLERRVRSGEEHPALESHFSKYRSLIPSLALLIHVTDGGKGPVGVEPLRKALAWGRYLSSHARRIYAVAVLEDVAAAKRLVARIRKGQVTDGFTERDVYHNDWSGLDRESVRKAVAVLVDHGWLCTQVEQTVGRPRTVCRINPRILKGPPDPTDKADGSPTVDVEVGQEATDITDESGSVPAQGPGEPTDETDRSADGEWGEL